MVHSLNWLKDSRRNDEVLEITCKHVDVCSIWDGEYVRRNFISSFTSVQFGTTSGVYRESFIRIDSNTKQTWVCLEKESVKNYSTKFWGACQSIFCIVSECFRKSHAHNRDSIYIDDSGKNLRVTLKKVHLYRSSKVGSGKLKFSKTTFWTVREWPWS